jgi:hypothetical protein
MFKILKDLAPIAQDRERKMQYILDQLHEQRTPCQLQQFEPQGFNIIVNQSPQNRVILSAHYDGDDLNDNLCSVAILLKLSEMSLGVETMLLFTDLEEQGGRGMQAFVDQYGTPLPMVVLELTGRGDTVLLGESAFGFMPYQGVPQYKEIPLDKYLLMMLEGCACTVGSRYRKQAVPPADHFIYAVAGGRSSLLSMAHSADFGVIERMRRGTPLMWLFEGINQHESTIANIPPYGRTNLIDLRRESMQTIYDLLRCFIKKI